MQKLWATCHIEVPGGANLSPGEQLGEHHLAALQAKPEGEGGPDSHLQALLDGGSLTTEPVIIDGPEASGTDVQAADQAELGEDRS